MNRRAAHPTSPRASRREDASSPTRALRSPQRTPVTFSGVPLGLAASRPGSLFRDQPRRRRMRRRFYHSPKDSYLHARGTTKTLPGITCSARRVRRFPANYYIQPLSRPELTRVSRSFLACASTSLSIGPSTRVTSRTLFPGSTTQLSYGSARTRAIYRCAFARCGRRSADSPFSQQDPDAVRAHTTAAALLATQEGLAEPIRGRSREPILKSPSFRPLTRLPSSSGPQQKRAHPTTPKPQPNRRSSRYSSSPASTSSGRMGQKNHGRKRIRARKPLGHGSTVDASPQTKDRISRATRWETSGRGVGNA
jgi:hypothetical protein